MRKIFDVGSQKHQGKKSTLSACSKVAIDAAVLFIVLFLIASITGNSSLEPLLEGLFAQIHVNLS